MKGITAILPAYNEEVSIGSVVLRTRQYAERVIVVDDGSSDRTAEIAELAGAEVIRHLENRGKGAALKTGFEVACDLKEEPYLNLTVDAAPKSRLVLLSGPEVMVTMDTDGQHDPSEIPKLVMPILNGEADMVIGSRYINGNKKDTPLYRRLGQVVLDAATNMDSGLYVTDSQSGFRAFAPYTMQVFRFNQNGLAIESEMLVDAANAGLKIKEVEIGVRYDVDCSSENPVSHGVKILVKILHDLELNRPLYYFTAPGIVMCIVGVGMGLEFLKAFYHGGALQFGPTLLMIMLTLVGVFMTFTGIILDALSRMISESNRNTRPHPGIIGPKKNDYRNSIRYPARDN